jgi:uncharacterized membrane protein YdjX (TVP38/TMEM64 family)
MMTTTQRQWLWIGAGVAAVAAALALGVPLGSVLIVAAALACPVAMYFGMRGMGMGQDCRHEGLHGHREMTFLRRELASASRTAGREERRKREEERR